MGDARRNVPESIERFWVGHFRISSMDFQFPGDFNIPNFIGGCRISFCIWYLYSIRVYLHLLRSEVCLRNERKRIGGNGRIKSIFDKWLFNEREMPVWVSPFLFIEFQPFRHNLCLRYSRIKNIENL